MDNEFFEGLRDAMAEGLEALRNDKTIPDREIWLHENKKALATVIGGLEQARAGHMSDGPDLDAALAEIAERELEDEKDSC